MNFKTPISTTREQSERLLALGVKPETADLCYNCYFVSIPLDVNHRGANLFKSCFSKKSHRSLACVDELRHKFSCFSLGNYI